MAAASCSFTTKKFEDPNKDKLLIDLITYVLNQGHYDAKEINDGFSGNVYEGYLEGLDPSKRFFYKEDIAIPYLFTKKPVIPVRGGRFLSATDRKPVDTDSDF